MNDIIDTFANRAPRYDITADNELTVTVEKLGALSEPLKAQLINISAGGAKFKVNKQIPVKDVLAVTIEAKHPERTIAVSGEVCWVNPTNNGDDWSLGCSFKPSIPDEVLHEFAEAGILERRQHRRRRISLHTTAKWELNRETSNVSVLDYSQGGFCLVSRNEVKPGDRVLLHFELDKGQDTVVRGKAIWQVAKNGEFVVGCEFVNALDFSVLHQMENGEVDRTPWAPQAWRLLPFKRHNDDGDPDGEHPENRSRIGSCSYLVTACVLVLLAIVIHACQSPETHVRRPRHPTPIAQATTSSPTDSPVDSLDHSPRDESDAALVGEDTSDAVDSADERQPDPTYEPLGAWPSEVATAPPEVDSALSGAHEVLVGDTGPSPSANENASTSQAPSEPDPETTIHLANALSKDDTPTVVKAVQHGNHKTTNEEQEPVDTDRPHLPIAAEVPTHSTEDAMTESYDRDGSTLEDGMPSERTSVAIEQHGPSDVPRPHSDQVSKSSPSAATATGSNESTRPISIVSNENRGLAVAAYRRGRNLYDLRKYDQAAATLQTAMKYDSGNAIYVYLLAMTQYQLGQFEQAEQTVRRAVDLERKTGVDAWGRRMERYQGGVRIWLEKMRRKARST